MSPPQENDQARLAVGQKIGQYVIESYLGSGAMGVVYRAVHSRMSEKHVAIKVLKRGLASDPRAVKRFEREAASVGRIGHPGIIDIIDFETLPDGTSYYAMELLEGESLGDVLRTKGPLPVADAIEVFTQVASALDAAHAKGVIHRDLKAENIFLTRRQGSIQVKLLDFGLAKIVQGEGAEAHLTRTGTTLGTPLYIAPEQWMGAEVDHRADIYALGVLAFRTMTGRFPFMSNKLHELLQMHLKDPPPRLSEIEPKIPRGLDEPMMKALAKKPSDRPPTAGKFIALMKAGWKGEAPEDVALATPDAPGLDPMKTLADEGLTTDVMRDYEAQLARQRASKAGGDVEAPPQPKGKGASPSKAKGGKSEDLHEAQTLALDRPSTDELDAARTNPLSAVPVDLDGATVIQNQDVADQAIKLAEANMAARASQKGQQKGQRTPASPPRTQAQTRAQTPAAMQPASVRPPWMIWGWVGVGVLGLVLLWVLYSLIRG